MATKENKRADLIKVAMGAAVLCALMQGREKITTEDIEGEPLTMTACEKVEYIDAEGANVCYYVAVFKEYPDNYYPAGKALSDICAAIIGNGMSDELAEYGLKIKLRKKKIANGRKFTAVDIIE